MSKVMKVKDFVNKAKDIANKYKTLYVMGCFGAPLNATNKKRYTTNSSYNKQASRKNMINKASSDTFGFDCVCLIKGILWGWSGNKNKIYGGAVYGSNGVDDVNADMIIKSKYCTNISTNFNNIIAGEIVWLKGHVGIYIGNSKVVECTPAFKNKVQITKLSQRKWLKHGKLKYIDYGAITKPANKSNEEIAKEVIAGKWGNGSDRKNRLTKAGYNYNIIQNLVTQMFNKSQKVITYTIKKGDTLTGIAKKYKTTINKIAKDNKISNPNKIYVGQKIKIYN